MRELVASVPNMHRRRRAILDRLPVDKPVTVVEVGVSSGLLAEGLLSARRDLRWWGIDSWAAADQQPVGYVETGDPHATLTSDHAALLMRLALQRISPFRDRATLIREASPGASRHFEDGAADLIFIDADHSFAGALADCRAWWAKVVPRGWLGGHDLRPSLGCKTHVEEAVREFSAEVGMPFDTGEGNTWWIRRP